MKPTVASLVFALSLLTYHSAVTQDLIVTKDQDSIQCKITKIADGNVYFDFRSNGQTLQTQLATSDILSHKRNFEAPKYSRIRIALDFGLSYRTAELNSSVPGDLRDYARKLKSGLNYAISYSGFFSETSGMGVKWSLHSSKNSESNYFIPQSRVRTEISDHILITYFGPYYTSRVISSNNGNPWLFNVGIGYLGYRNNAKVGSEFTLRGQTVGLNLDIGHDFMLSKKHALGLQVSYIAGRLTKMQNGSQTIELDEGNYESLHRLDVTFGLRFY